MGRAKGSAPSRERDLEREVARLRREIESMRRRLSAQDERIRRLLSRGDDTARRQAVLIEALQLGDRPRRGDRGILRELQESVIRVEDYLLKTSERIENILSALKQHREFLVTMNNRVLNVGTKDRIRLELDVMKNTLSILTLNGMELDTDLVREIEKLRRTLPDASDLAELERAKAELDKKFNGELKKFDLDAIWAKRKEIPGYG